MQLLQKDPRGWQEFADQLKSHSPRGSALIMRGVQAKRTTIFDIEDQLGKVEIPTLIMVGDEDEPCLDSALSNEAKDALAGLAVLPKSGHAINLEEPDLFNRSMLDFFHAVEHGRWFRRGEVTTSLLPAELRA